MKIASYVLRQSFNLLMLAEAFWLIGVIAGYYPIWYQPPRQATIPIKATDVEYIIELKKLAYDPSTWRSGRTDAAFKALNQKWNIKADVSLTTYGFLNQEEIDITYRIPLPGFILRTRLGLTSTSLFCGGSCPLTGRKGAINITTGDGQLVSFIGIHALVK